MTKHAEGQFLHQQNQNLHNSTEVESVVGYLRTGGENIPNDPAAKIEAHLGFLANQEYVNDGVLTGDQASLDRQIEAASISLTPENAHAYVKFQARVAREQGHGDVIDPDGMDNKDKMTALRLVRSDQQQQLAEWVQELNSEETNYPDWFKHWMFENVKRHTAFNEDLGKDGHPKGFEKRSGSSFVLFPELDRESVSLMFEALTEKLGGQPMGFEYDDMRKLLAKANFAELYTEAQNYGFKITDKLKDVTTGSWHDFSQSDKKSDAQALSDLVKSYRTGWCTAGLTTAATQLQGGDFYVWCSTNPESGKDEVPRIAVRMENGMIAEVRGIIGGRKQELEPELMDTVMAKIKDLPGGEAYFEKAKNMKRVTELEKKLVADSGMKLTKEEVRFLYELDGPIIGFGYGNYGGFGRDPRVDELKALRGEQDHPLLKELAVEYIREHFATSYRGYQTTAELLGASARSEQEIQKLYEAKLAQWEQAGVLDYVAERIISHGELHMPVITPDVLASPKEIMQFAQQFGNEQPYKTILYEDLYNQYSAQELSGSGQLRISLIPSKYDPELTASVETQRRMLAQKQSEQPTLDFRVPNVLEALAYWQTSRAGGDKLADSSAFDKTIIRHFDLDPK